MIKKTVISISIALLMNSSLLYAENNSTSIKADYEIQKVENRAKLEKASMNFEAIYNKYPENSKEVSSAYKILAKAHDKIDTQSTINYYLKALKIDKKILKEDDLEIAKDYILVGDIYYYSKQYQTAVFYFEKAIEIREKVLGKDHIDTAAAYQYIAGSYDSLDESPQALLYSRKLLVIQEKILGKDNEKTKITRINIEFLESKLKAN